MQKFTLFQKMKRAALIALLAGILPTASFAQVYDTIGTGTVASNSYGPIRIGASAASSFSTKVVTMFTQSDLAAIGITPGAVINSIAWQKTGTNVLTNGASVNLTVSFRDQIDSLTYGSGVNSPVYINNYIASGFTVAGSKTFSATGENLPADTFWVTIPFSSPYTYTGGNLEVLMHNIYTGGAGNPSTAAINWRLTTTPTNSGLYYTMYTNNPQAYSNTATVNLSQYRANTVFNYIPGPVCTGAPNAGTITMDTTKACPGMLAGHLNLIGASSGSGLTLQWEKKAQGETIFTDIPNATGYQLISQSVVVPTEYRVKVTCSGTTITSPSLNMIPTIYIAPDYLQDFTATASWFGSTAPGCWEGRIGIMDEPVTFTPSATPTGYAVGQWASDGWNNTSTLGAARIRLTANIYDWLISPGLNLCTGNWQLDFDLGVFTYNAAGAGVMGVDDYFAVVISTDGGATFTMTNILREFTATNTAFPLTNGAMHVTIPLTAYSGNIKLGFYGSGGTLNPTPTSLSPDLMIDNVRLLPFGTVLPVKMSALTAQINKQGDGALSWKTYKEENNSGFIIEKSTDGKAFHQLGTQASKAPKGNSNTTIDYTFIDPEYNTSNVYYRLKEVNTDGANAYSNIAQLYFGQSKEEALQVYPNPARNEVNVVFKNTPDGTDKLTVTNVTGTVILSENKLKAQMNINISTLPAGIYFVNYTGAQGTTVHKIVKL